MASWSMILCCPTRACFFAGFKGHHMLGEPAIKSLWPGGLKVIKLLLADFQAAVNIHFRLCNLSCWILSRTPSSCESGSIGSLQGSSVLRIEFLSSASRWIRNLSSSLWVICAESEPPVILLRSLVSVCAAFLLSTHVAIAWALCVTNDPFWTMAFSQPGGFYELVRWHSIPQTIYVMYSFLTFDEFLKSRQQPPHWPNII